MAEWAETCILEAALGQDWPGVTQRLAKLFPRELRELIEACEGVADEASKVLHRLSPHPELPNVKGE